MVAAISAHGWFITSSQSDAIAWLTDVVTIPQEESSVYSGLRSHEKMDQSLEEDYKPETSEEEAGRNRMTPYSLPPMRSEQPHEGYMPYSAPGLEPVLSDEKFYSGEMTQFSSSLPDDSTEVLRVKMESQDEAVSHVERDHVEAWPRVPEVKVTPDLIPAFPAVYLETTELWEYADKDMSIDNFARNECFDNYLQEHSDLWRLIAFDLNALGSNGCLWTWCLNPESFEQEKGLLLWNFLHDIPIASWFSEGHFRLHSHTGGLGLRRSELRSHILEHFALYLLHFYMLPYACSKALSFLQDRLTAKRMKYMQANLKLIGKCAYNPTSRQTVPFCTAEIWCLETADGKSLPQYGLGQLRLATVNFEDPFLVLVAAGVESSETRLYVLAPKHGGKEGMKAQIQLWDFPVPEDVPESDRFIHLWSEGGAVDGQQLDWAEYLRGQSNLSLLFLGFNVYRFLACRAFSGVNAAIGISAWWSPYILRYLYGYDRNAEEYWKLVTKIGNESLAAIQQRHRFDEPYWSDYFKIRVLTRLSESYVDQLTDEEFTTTFSLFASFIVDGIVNDNTLIPQCIEKWAGGRGKFPEKWSHSNRIMPKAKIGELVYSIGRRQLFSETRKFMDKFTKRIDPHTMECSPFILKTVCPSSAIAIAALMSQPDLMARHAKLGRTRVCIMSGKHLHEICRVLLNEIIPSPFLSTFDGILGAQLTPESRWKNHADVPGIVYTGPLVGPPVRCGKAVEECEKGCCQHRVLFPSTINLSDNPLTRWCSRFTYHGWLSLEWRTKCLRNLINLIDELEGDAEPRGAIRLMLQNDLDPDCYEEKESDDFSRDSLLSTARYLLVRLGPSVSAGSANLLNEPYESAGLGDTKQLKKLSKNDLATKILKEANLVIQTPLSPLEFLNVDPHILIYPEATELTSVQLLNDLLYRNRLCFVLLFTQHNTQVSD